MPSDELEQYGEMKAHEIQERRNRRKAEKERATQNRKLRAEWAPKLWQEVREMIAHRVDAINAALGETALECDGSKADFVTIHVAHMPTNLYAAYDGPSGRVTLNLDDHTETYDLEVVKGEVKFK